VTTEEPVVGELIRGGSVLPATREDIELTTDDGLVLVGEVSTPAARPPIATLICLHPLPTAGGFMDSHIIRKAAARLPALADIAVVRFNFRGVSSARGRSEGEFGHAEMEKHDLDAAVRFTRERNLPNPWILGWSFGTEVALKYGLQHEVVGAILLSPPLHRTTANELAAWAGSGKQLVVVVPEHDTYLRPPEATARFAAVPERELVVVEGGKHLWVGENQTYRVLTEIVQRLNPAALPLPTTWTPA
jgi:uncharacterized protein